MDPSDMSRLIRGSAPTPDSASGAIEVVDAEDALGIGVGSDILIVDDNETNLVAYQAALEPLGRRLVLAESGIDAVSKLLDQDFAIMLLDVAMPGMSGLETARLARQRPRNKALPVVFITGEASSTELIIQAYDVGACDFVVKPIMPDLLRAKVRVFLQLQERTQALLAAAVQLRDVHVQLDASQDIARDRAKLAIAAIRLRKLQDATAALARAKTPADVARAVVRLGAEAVDASAAVMWTMEPDGSLELASSHGVPDDYLHPWRRISAGADLPAMRVAASQTQMWVQNEVEFAHEAPELVDQARAAGRLSAFAALPLVTDGNTLGVLTFTYGAQHLFTSEERAFLAALEHACEHALDRARLYVAEQAARQAADAASRRKDEFLAMLGHELRNPLAAITSAFELHKQRGEPLSHELEIADRQVTHLTRMVNDLVDVSRVMRGRIVLRREAVDLQRALKSALDLARHVLAQREHEVNVRIPQNLLVDADRERLVQVLANLISNAAKYTPGKGRIDVIAESDEAFVQIEVRDNGIGIPAPLLPSLFEPFVQGERSLDRHLGGLGVGLTLVRTLVELHGGTICAESPGPGGGATFTLRWPRPSSQTPTEEFPTLPVTATGPALRILVVDDNEDAAEVLGALLQTLGHTVHVAHDADGALAAARDFLPDVAFLDIGLPGTSGYHLAQQLSLLPTAANTTLIALTGYGLPDDQDRALRVGFAHHHVKPVDLNTLRALLAQLVPVRRS